MLRVFIFVLLNCFIFFQGNAQYFGRNKPKYKDFDFKTLNTEHFKIYYYDLDSLKIRQYGQWFETWYAMHKQILMDSFEKPNPVILYNSHADFQQTFAIGGNIDVGTGGVTEGLQNRIVLPLALTNEQTFHVFGHELVHAFQYKMILNGDSTNFASLANYPLWSIEGLAEYLSIGRHDAHTAMWMRDAVLRDEFPSLRKMSNPKYFPYRYGQAFWSFFAGMFGDDKIKPFFMAIGKYGFDYACEDILQIKSDTLSAIWQRSMKKFYQSQIKAHEKIAHGKKIVDDDNAGKVNISPSLSPNGKYIAFLSEKDLFTTDLFLANASNGKIIKKLYSSIKEGHIDNLNAIESAGAWSPDSKKFAFCAFKRGQSVLIIKNVEKSKTEDELTWKEIPYFAHPAWSPDGKSIILSGLVNGQTDLFQIDIKTKNVRQLTNDKYSEIQSDWAIDGKSIYFSTDKNSIDNGRVNGHWIFNLATLNLENNSISYYEPIPNANCFNPQSDNKGNIIFVSDLNGYRNIYSYNPDSNATVKLTEMINGVTGLTPFGPSISVSQNRDKIIYSAYQEDQFQIYQAFLDKLPKIKIDSASILKQDGAILPFENPRVSDVVNTQLNSLDKITQNNLPSSIEKYKPQFSLSYIGAGAGAGLGNGFYGGVGLSGGVNMLFNDMLSNHQLYTGLALNGEFQDIAGTTAYINQSKRFPWGISLNHTPLRYVSVIYGQTFQRFIDDNGQSFDAITDTTEIFRIFEDELNLFVQYPLSVTQRVEAGIGGTYQFFSYRRNIDYFGDFNRFVYYGTDKEKLKVGNKVFVGPYVFEKGFLYNVNAAWVGDNSFFGMTAPLLGYRYRLGIEQYFGQYQFTSLTLDGRKYFWKKPFSIAMRVLHYARFGKDANNFYPTLLGQYGLMHGYSYDQLDNLKDRYDIDFEEISGSKIIIASTEFRLPITGPKRLALIPANFMPIDFNVFVDGGLAWNNYADFKSSNTIKPLPVFSTGLGLRLNVFNAIIFEPYFAWPIQKNTKASFGFNLVPGW